MKSIESVSTVYQKPDNHTFNLNQAEEEIGK